jgi:hypothetical protein
LVSKIDIIVQAKISSSFSGQLWMPVTFFSLDVQTPSSPYSGWPVLKNEFASCLSQKDWSFF